MVDLKGGAGEGNRTLVVSLGSFGGAAKVTLFRGFSWLASGTWREHRASREGFYRGFTARTVVV